NHPALRERISSFQAELIRNQPPIPGLDSSIIIDPRRMHITLGVMHLEQDIPSASHSRPVRHTVSTALDLLRSLQPQLAQTSGTKLSITLDSMDIFQPQRNFGEAGALGANVLFIGPSNSDDKRLRDICDMTHRTFRQHGYITEKRPLKLHCSILNTSHRKPRRRQPFSYSAILASNAHRPLTCLPVNLGTWEIHRIELWVMGSHGPNNEYISCGGIGLDSASK
ncbi:kinase A anchor protein, partial [Infundibulicybe gibba]